MCQLTYIRTPKLTFNRILLTNQLLFNTANKHKDGFGVCHDNGIYRNHIVPGLVNELGDITGQITDRAIAHVRHATKLHNKLLIGKEYNHPFESENFIFAHNGSLGLFKKEDEDRFRNRDIIDSQMFLEVLEEEYKADKDFLSALDRASKRFYGKFAFLIRNKNDGLDYAVRGKLAALHMSTVKQGDSNIGYIINTEKDDLKKALTLSKMVANSLGVNLEYTDPIELPQDSVFSLGNTSVQVISQIKEQEKPFSPIGKTSSATKKNRTFVTIPDPLTGKNPTSSSSLYTGSLNKLSDFVSYLETIMIEFMLSTEELDKLFLVSMGTSIASLEEKDIVFFNEFIAPVLKKNMFKGRTKVWEEFIKAGLVFDTISFLYGRKELNFQFPWMFNSKSQIRWVHNKLLKEKIQRNLGNGIM